MNYKDKYLKYKQKYLNLKYGDIENFQKGGIYYIPLPVRSVLYPYFRESDLERFKSMTKREAEFLVAKMLQNYAFDISQVQSLPPEYRSYVRKVKNIDYLDQLKGLDNITHASFSIRFNQPLNPSVFYVPTQLQQVYIPASYPYKYSIPQNIKYLEIEQTI